MNLMDSACCCCFFTCFFFLSLERARKQRFRRQNANTEIRDTANISCAHSVCPFVANAWLRDSHTHTHTRGFHSRFDQLIKRTIEFHQARQERYRYVRAFIIFAYIPLKNELRESHRPREKPRERRKIENCECKAHV